MRPYRIMPLTEPPPSFLAAISQAQQDCADGDFIVIHREVEGVDEHENSDSCWCGPVKLDPQKSIDAATLYAEVAAYK